MTRLITGILLTSLFFFAIYSNAKHEKLAKNAVPATLVLLVPGILLSYFGWRSTASGTARQLRSSDPVKRRYAALKLIKSGKIEQLISLLNERESLEVKNAACDALIKIGKPAIEPLIRAALWKEIDSAEAVRILARIPDDALKQLQKAMQMQNLEIQGNATRLMYEIAKRVPSEALATSLLDAAKAEEAENVARKLLDQNPISETVLILWKKARRAQGKELTLDVPEDKKKQIYCEYQGILDGEFLAQSHFATDFQRAAKKANISEMDRMLKEKSAAANSAAQNEILQRYKLGKFDLDLILQQGKREAWPVSTLSSEAASEVPSQEAFRNSLRCQHCGKRNVASFWPQRGDWIGFHYQSEERTREQPGAFRLPISCPHCSKIWYVVWDTSPDPLAEIFVNHIGRICNSFNHDPEKSKPFLQLLSNADDLMDMIRKELENSIARQNKVERIFSTDTNFQVLWIIPVVALPQVRRYIPNGYFVGIDPAIQKWDRQKKHFVHWIYCCDGQQAAVHLTFLARKDDQSRLTSMFPVDLLNPDEKRQLGL
jgi:hypothetical protein